VILFSIPQRALTNGRALFFWRTAMNETTFDESTFETGEVSELDCVKYAYGRHITIDGLDEHPLTAQDEFLACMARHVDWEDSALVPDA
jgi:hypothetical protein